MEETSLIKTLKDWLSQLKKDRRSWEPYWQDIKNYISPQRARFLTSSDRSEINRGDKKDQAIINGAASRAAGVMASGMQSGLTSKARPWFMLESPDPGLNKYKPVQEWYKQVQDIILGLFSRSNIYAGFLHTYHEIGLFGTGALALLSHPQKVLYSRPYTTGTYYIAINDRLDVDVFFYVEYKNVRQLVLEYGKDKLPSELQQKYDAQQFEERYETINAVIADPAKYGIKSNQAHPVVSLHFLNKAGDNDGFLRVSGYRSFPVMTPRWDTIDTDTYGWAPARDVIGNVKMLQSIEADSLKAIAKLASPPMRIPPELERRGLNMRAGGLNVVSSASENAVAPLFTVNPNPQALQYKIDAVVADIREGFFNSLFLALLTGTDKTMTAREVAERHEEKLLMLGPVLERIHYELLDPFINRAFLLAWEAGLIPPPPHELEGTPTQIEYISILSQAQKAVSVSRIEQSTSYLGSLLSAYPGIRHAFDPYKAYMEYNRAIGAPPSIFASEEDYQKAVDSEARQAAQQQQMQIAQQATDSAAVLSKVNPADVQRLLAGTSGSLAL